MSNTMTPRRCAAFAAQRAGKTGWDDIQVFRRTLDTLLGDGGNIARQWSVMQPSSKRGRGEAALLRHITNRNHRGVALVAAHIANFLNPSRPLEFTAEVGGHYSREYDECQARTYDWEFFCRPPAELRGGGAVAANALPTGAIQSSKCRPSSLF